MQNKQKYLGFLMQIKQRKGAPMKLILTVIILSFLSQVALAENYYVSTAGDDSNSLFVRLPMLSKGAIFSILYPVFVARV